MSKTIRTTDGEINLGSTKITQGLQGTGIAIPIGTTAQRPTGPATGTFRFNGDLARFEGYNGVNWATQANIGDNFALPSYTVAQLATLTAAVGSLAYCSNATGGAIPVFYDGTNWRLFSNRNVVS